MSERLAYSIAEAGEAASISRTAVYAAIGAGALEARKHGARTVILAEELQRWLHELPRVQRRAEAA